MPVIQREDYREDWLSTDLGILALARFKEWVRPWSGHMQSRVVTTAINMVAHDGPVEEISLYSTADLPENELCLL